MISLSLFRYVYVSIFFGGDGYFHEKKKILFLLKNAWIVFNEYDEINLKKSYAMDTI